MNVCMPLCKALDGTGDRRAIDEEFGLSKRIGIGRALVRLSFVRQKRAEHALVEAEAPLRRARAELQQAERELAENKRRLSASALDWRTASPHRETLGRELVRAHAALLERSAQLAAQVERVAASARLCLQAQGNLRDARAIYARASRRNEQLRRWVRDLEKSGNP